MPRNVEFKCDRVFQVRQYYFEEYVIQLVFLLSNMQLFISNSFKDIAQFSKRIQEIMASNFLFVMKLLVKSFSWKRHDVKVYLQNFIVN